MFENWTTRQLKDSIALYGCGGTAWTYADITIMRAELVRREDQRG